ncbi:putative Transcriptional activator [Giardia muris]|uniref:Chromatin-remodeling ATPase INO80 n=1 Tax=Giardia muris TaxID=5742 RepID=A0A4Z1SKT2_GIAMU|nr:putative Transcriptional activator [Giardia muris]|eukprot:TNJ26232.1 putative Transcriptional activator [Giardia muris]
MPTSEPSPFLPHAAPLRLYLDLMLGVGLPAIPPAQTSSLVPKPLGSMEPSLPSPQLVEQFAASGLTDEAFLESILTRNALLNDVQISELDKYGRLSLTPVSEPFSIEPQADLVMSCTFEVAEYLQGSRAIASFPDDILSADGWFPDRDTSFLHECSITCLTALGCDLQAPEDGIPEFSFLGFERYVIDDLVYVHPAAVYDQIIYRLSAKADACPPQFRPIGALIKAVCTYLQGIRPLFATGDALPVVLTIDESLIFTFSAPQHGQSEITPLLYKAREGEVMGIGDTFELALSLFLVSFRGVLALIEELQELRLKLGHAQLVPCELLTREYADELKSKTLHQLSSALAFAQLVLLVVSSRTSEGVPSLDRSNLTEALLPFFEQISVLNERLQRPVLRALFRNLTTVALMELEAKPLCVDAPEALPPLQGSLPLTVFRALWVERAEGYIREPRHILTPLLTDAPPLLISVRGTPFYRRGNSYVSETTAPEIYPLPVAQINVLRTEEERVIRKTSRIQRLKKPAPIEPVEPTDLQTTVAYSYTHNDATVDSSVTLFGHLAYMPAERVRGRQQTQAQYVATIQSRNSSYATRQAARRLRSNKQSYTSGIELVRLRKFNRDLVSTWKRLQREGRDAFNREARIKTQLEAKRAEKLYEKRQQERLEFLIKQTEQYTISSVQSKAGSKMAENLNAMISSIDQGDAFKTTDPSAIDPANNKTLNISGLNIDLKQTPKNFCGTLKRYQIVGFSWLVNRFELELNSILSDEMGLGKSVQTIAFFQHLVEAYGFHGPFMIVAPNSLLSNWVKELKRFAPNLNVWPYWGSVKDRSIIKKAWSTSLNFGNQLSQTLKKNKKVLGHPDSVFHIVVTSYQIAVAEVRTLSAIPWTVVVLDEGQMIKSSETARWRTIMQYKSRCKVLLSGTPIQNSLAELWALLHFVMPELFMNKEDFAEWFSRDIESAANRLGNVKLNPAQLRRLQGVLAPFVLRRVKSDVEKDLGAKKEIILMCGMSRKQRTLYAALRSKLSLDSLLSKTTRGVDDDIKNLVMQLRKVCCHPELFERTQATSAVTMSFLISEYRWHQRTPYLAIQPDEDADDDDAQPYSEFGGLNPVSSVSSITGLTTLEQAEPSPKVVLQSSNTGGTVLDAEASETTDTRSKRASSFRRSPPTDLERFTDLFTQFGFTDSSRENYLGRQVTLMHACSDLVIDIPVAVYMDLYKDLGTKRAESVIAHRFNLFLESDLLSTVSRLLDLSRQDLALLATFPLQLAQNLASPALIPLLAPFLFDTQRDVVYSAVRSLYELIGRQYLNLERSVLYSPGLTTVTPMNILSYTEILPLPEEDGAGEGCYHLFSKYLWLRKVHNHLFSDLCASMTVVSHEIPPRAFGLPPQVILPPIFITHIPWIMHSLLRGEVVYRGKMMSGEHSAKMTGITKLHIPLCTELSNSLIACPILPRSTISLIRDSGKLTALDRILYELNKKKEPVLIYCQMTKMLDILEDYLIFRRYAYVRLDGSDNVTKRGQIVDKFMCDHTVFVFLLSTRAAALGLNLTRASTVIFYENDWNPTQDAQAMDRVHRLGQKKAVTIYRLVTRGTIDERILQRAQGKEIVQELVLRGQKRDEHGNLVHSDAYDVSSAQSKQKRRPLRDEILDLLAWDTEKA